MRNRLLSWGAQFAVAAALAVAGPGCTRERPETPDAQQMEAILKVPGASNVFAALDQKDYEAAIAVWAKINQSPSAQAQATEIALLTREMRLRLVEASATDPKAAEALDAFRAATGGR